MLILMALGTLASAAPEARRDDPSWSSSSARSARAAGRADALIAEFGSVAGMLAAGPLPSAHPWARSSRRFAISA